MFNIHLTTNLLRNFPVNKIANRLRFDGIMVMSLWPRFLANPVYLMHGAVYAAATCPCVLSACLSVTLHKQTRLD